MKRVFAGEPVTIIGKANPAESAAGSSLITPENIRLAAEIVKTTSPEDIPQFPQVLTAVNSFMSRLPWWVVVAAAGAAGYMLGRRGR